MRSIFKAVAVFTVLCLTSTSHARYYDPEYGRFLSRDEMEGKLDNAPSLHRFAYAHANPVRYTDPTGHCVPWCVPFIALGLAVGFRSDADANIAVALPAPWVALSMSIDHARAGLEEREVLARGNSSPATEKLLLDVQERKKDALIGFAGAAIASPARLSISKSPFEVPPPAPFVRSTRPPGGYANEGAEFITEPEAGTPPQTVVRESAAKPSTKVVPYDEAAAIARGEGEGMALASGPQIAPAPAPPSPSPANTFITYEFWNPSKEPVYVGRASGPGTPEKVMKGRLAKGHDVYDENPGLTPVIKAVQGNKLANQGAEGVLYEQRLREGAKLLNDPKSPPLSDKPAKAADVRAKIDAYADDLKKP